VEKKKILLVDDDADFRNAVAAGLKAQNFEVVTAADGEEGVNAALKESPDLVVLDVMMPRKDGYSACAELKENDSTRAIPVLILTSLGDQKSGLTAPAAVASGHGADAYLEKPVDPDTLAAKARELIEASEAENKDASHVLIIDDDTDFTQALKVVLAQAGYRISSAATGEEGLLAVRAQQPDLVILDVMLPGMDGFKVCRELKSDEKTKGIPVIILTAMADKMAEADYGKAIAVTHQADEYMEKPVEASELLKKVKKFIGPSRRLV